MEVDSARLQRVTSQEVWEVLPQMTHRSASSWYATRNKYTASFYYLRQVARYSLILNVTNNWWIERN